ncbi:ubiquitin carboxyl-terminal hydrolase 7-like [Episyrphus balteatus]|uniref:ubiquitin carboxyl-terminal hydrolase 7-like n=1 Tax=Episyrphus balteatus TaxID=286459 RepID=UPI0024854C7B|nr:ubiquitin carboxyl-terminal hydrolase 7-like [Episyrphus balteatus]
METDNAANFAMITSPPADAIDKTICVSTTIISDRQLAYMVGEHQEEEAMDTQEADNSLIIPPPIEPPTPPETPPDSPEPAGLNQQPQQEEQQQQLIKSDLTKPVQILEKPQPHLEEEAETRQVADIDDDANMKPASPIVVDSLTTPNEILASMDTTTSPLQADEDDAAIAATAIEQKIQQEKQQQQEQQQKQQQQQQVVDVAKVSSTTGPKLEDEVRSEATFSYIVRNISKLKETELSPPTYVRNLPWRIMVMVRNPRNQPEAKSLGFFLQCNGESDSTTWSCNASAELRLKSFKAGQEAFVQKIKHLFYSKENDWGFSIFIAWNDIFNPDKGYVQNDCIVLEVHVMAEAPHGVFWDSKKHTGYVGLKNQGATCYMNSLLQTLYFTCQLRKSVYKMPTEADDSSKSVGLALQRVFHDLQFADKPVGTKKLTKSFGWETLDSFMQHDVQEFLRVLLDKLESKMKGTCVEGTVPHLFEGKMSSYIKCKNVDCNSTRCETFYDIQLNIKNKKNIYESFHDYIDPETLEGDNKYDAGIHGLQEAEKGVIFTSFPPVLHLHLMRFQYDPFTDNSVKFNDRFEFYDEINLDSYLAEKELTPATYKLHAVLVHSGDNHGGHYVVYINTNAEGKWCKFDDDVVSSCTKTEAIEQNYGGADDEIANAKNCSNAYMLVYIRVSELPRVLQELTENDIPSDLVERLNEEKRMEQVRRKDRAEAGLYLAIHVILEEYFEGNQGTEIFDLEKVTVRAFKLKKTQTVADLIQTFVLAFRVHEKRIRIWPLAQRSQAQRFTYFNIAEEYNRTLSSVIELQGPWVVFLELASPLHIGPLPIFEKKRDILLFFKYYDPANKRLHYLNCGQYALSFRISDLVPQVNLLLGFDPSTELTVYEECGNNPMQRLTNQSETLGRTLNLSNHDSLHGNILIFEKKHVDEKLELPTVEDYFRDLLSRIELTFCDKSNPNDPGFLLELSNRNTYDQMAHAVAIRINTDPNRIQFFKCIPNYKDTPGNALRCLYDCTIKDLLCFTKPRTPKKLFYQRLSMNIHELENKRQFKCQWLSSNLKEERELILYPNKSGTIKNLLEEAAKQIQFSDESTRKLRLVEVANHKLLPRPREDTTLESLQPPDTMANQSHHKIYRIEEVPRDELLLMDTEMLIPVAHFSKDIYSSFGIPFFIKARHGEPFSALKERIQIKLNIPEKEWEKFKFATVALGRIEYIADDNLAINLDIFKHTTQGGSPLPFFGLEHVNKSQKRTRYNYLEKAIKIYN